MHDIASKIGDRQRHTVRAVHAKSQAFVKAEVVVKVACQSRCAKDSSRNRGLTARSCAFRPIPGTSFPITFPRRAGWR